MVTEAAHHAFHVTSFLNVQWLIFAVKHKRDVRQNVMRLTTSVNIHFYYIEKNAMKVNGDSGCTSGFSCYPFFYVLHVQIDNESIFIFVWTEPFILANFIDYECNVTLKWFTFL